METTEELSDLIARTRPVILEILREQGYDTKPYDSQSPADIAGLSLSGPNALRIRLYAKEGPDGSEAPTKRAQVFYWVFEKVKMSLGRRVEELWDTDSYKENAADQSTDEAIVILNEPLHDAFHASAIQQWLTNKRRIVFYSIKQLISNPSKHILQPKFRKIPASDSQLLTNLRLKTKKNLPLIKFHVDIMSRVLGLVPDDIVEIIRPSPTAGDYKMYRICSL
jgi:DNA-directed RNA polymerase subunit H (RpoH/RPB5)